MIQLHACVFISTPVSLEGRLENEAELQWMSYYEGTFFCKPCDEHQPWKMHQCMSTRCLCGTVNTAPHSLE